MNTALRAERTSLVKRFEPWDLLEMALRGARADEAAARLTEKRETVARFADNAVIQPTAVDTAQVAITAAFGQRSGTASTGDLTAQGLAACREKAEAIALASPPNPEYMPMLGPQSYLPIDGFCEATASVESSRCVGIAAEAIEAARESGQTLSGSFAAVASRTALLNSRGLRASHCSTRAQLLATGFQEGFSGWARQVETDIARIDARRTANRALEKARLGANPTAVAPGRYTLLLEPAAAADFFLPLFWDFGARAADEGRSALSGKLGRKVGAEMVSIYSDPADSRCPSAPYSAEGLPRRRTAWIERGRLENLAADRFWALKTGRDPLPAPANVLMEGGEETIEQLAGRIDRGLLATRFWYVRSVDPMAALNTGMTRDGFFLIENGRLAGAARNMRWNDSALAALERVEALGRRERAGEALMPAMIVRDFHFTSATQF